MGPVTTKIEGCLVFNSSPLADQRGSFQKIFSMDPSAVEDNWLLPQPAEIFWSTSHKGVARGLHFQKPPHSVSKFVVCVKGTITDVITDLRSDSPTYRKTIAITLSESAGIPTAVFVPVGCAHGFITESEEATVLYLQSGIYNSDSDSGIDFLSGLGSNHPLASSIKSQSERDQNFQSIFELEEWTSFEWNKTCE